MPDQKVEKIHELSVQQRNPVQIYSMDCTKDVVNKSKNWVTIPGIYKQIEIKDNGSFVIIQAHSHVHVVSGGRVDLGILVDNKLCGIAHQITDKTGWVKGTALSHVANWVPAVSIASFTANKGVYVIQGAVRNVCDNGEARSNSTSMLIQVFEPIPILQWIDMNLNDKTLRFNKDLEYRIELKAENMVYPVMVTKEKLWFYNCDDLDNNNIQSGLVFVKYDTKRAVNGQHYIVTKIQARTSK